MTLRMSAALSVGDLLTQHITQAVVRSSYREMTDTCEVTLPRRLRLKDRRLEDLVNVGDPIRLNLGYDEELVEVFVGFVTDLTPGERVVIKAEDAMWRLKTGVVTQSFPSGVALATVLAAILPPGIPFTAAEVTLGALRFSRVTPAKILDELRRAYGLQAYFRAGVLYVGTVLGSLAEGGFTPRRLPFDLTVSVASHDLQFRRKEQTPLQVEAISLTPEGGKLTTTVGDPEGEKRTLHYSGLTLPELKKRAEADLERLRYDGYRGTLSVFGVRQVRHGDVIVLTDPNYPEREGAYYAEAVEISYGEGGYRQTLTLGARTT